MILTDVSAYFKYVISWSTLSWPKRIADQMELAEGQMLADQEKFQKKLLDDQLQLEDRLDSLQMIVAGFSGRTDLSKAAEIANEVRRVMKDLIRKPHCTTRGSSSLRDKSHR